MVCSLSACVTCSGGTSFLRGKMACGQAHQHRVCRGSRVSPSHVPPVTTLSLEALNHFKPVHGEGGNSVPACLAQHEFSAQRLTLRPSRCKPATFSGVAHQKQTVLSPKEYNPTCGNLAPGARGPGPRSPVDAAVGRGGKVGSLSLASQRWRGWWASLA